MPDTMLRVGGVGAALPVERSAQGESSALGSECPIPEPNLCITPKAARLSGLTVQDVQ